MNEPYVLGIDGGQTSTKAALCTLSGCVALRLDAGPWDTTRNRQGRNKCMAALHQIRNRLSERMPGAVLSRVCIGMTGGLSGRDLVSRWAMRILGCANVTVYPDMATNLRGANPLSGDGVVVIAGGGSVAWGKNSSGDEALAGGFGYLLGDAGSAYEIARQAIVSSLMAHQSRGPHTALADAVMRHFGARDAWEARLLVYSGKADVRSMVSALAPEVSRLAVRGDPEAQRIVRQAGEDLASMAASVIERLGQPRVNVYPTGGVLSRGSPVRACFAEALAAIEPEAQVLEPELPPLGGAVCFALESAGTLSLEHVTQLKQGLDKDFASARRPDESNRF